MSWNPQQQAMLSAMGYTLYRQAGAVPAAMPALPAAVSRGDVAPGAQADRLLQALARAAGGHDLAALALPPIEQLRASGAAKRALWPSLRALRRKR
ncbi:MAG: hypothetical protein NT046_08445 [Arenimonas sp.]|nr:hypothetical protein [Arenimonas sp.]